MANYGTPGAPDLDPYFISPRREREIEEDRIANIESTIDTYSEDLAGVLKDMAESLKKYGATIVAVSADPVTLKFKIEVES